MICWCNPVLTVTNLRVGYAGVPVLRGLSFTLEGGVLAILGPSGCGKTTLLNVLAGVLPQTGGEVLFHGRPLEPASTAIGLIPQGYGLLPWKTVRENCLLCAKLRGRQVNPEPLARELGIDFLLDRYPRALSGGQAQRVALARALLMEPALLLLDEPFAALDMAVLNRTRRLCLDMLRERRMTALVVTHRLEDALCLGNSIAVMDRRGFRCFLDNPWQGADDPTAAHTALLARLEAELQAAEDGRMA